MSNESVKNEPQRARFEEQVWLTQSHPVSEGELAEIEEQLTAAPAEVELLIKKGRALARGWYFQQAIDVYSYAISLHPFHALLYRHRGHAFINTRRLELARADLELASRLDESNWDSWYHLMLAEYMLGHYDRAERAGRQILLRANNDYMVICASDWTWMALMRASKREAAAKLIEPIGEQMDAGEAACYHRRLLMYKGLIAPEALLEGQDSSGAEYAALQYGLGNYHFVQGRQEQAIVTWREAVHCPYWPSFGMVASASELARLGFV